MLHLIHSIEAFSLTMYFCQSQQLFLWQHQWNQTDITFAEQANLNLLTDQHTEGATMNKKDM